MPVKSRREVPNTSKVKIPFTPANGRYKAVFTRQEMRNESRAALFQDSDDDDEQECQTDEIEFEIEEEDQADETSEKQMHQMVVARMISGRQ